MPGLQPGLTRKDTQHILTLTIMYIPKALGIMPNARTSAWVNQKGYTAFPFIDHE